jgi:AcrR family transcriptional regulator
MFTGLLDRVNTLSYVDAMTKRLAPEDWIAAAFRALGQGGLAAVRVEPLARELGVSKGSFYWHFKDLPSLLQVMLTHWEDQATERIIAMAETASPDPVDRLLRLSELATGDLDEPYGGFHTEAAIRDWSRHDPAAGAVQARVDRRRLAYLAAAFDAAGRPEPLLRARVLLAGLVGAQNLAPVDPETRRAQMAMLLELLLVVQLDGAGMQRPDA